MFSLVLCLVFIIFRVEANVSETENPEIRLSYTYNKEENYTVWKDKPLKIIIENGYARFVWCFNYYFNGASGKFIPETELSNDTIIKLSITNVTADMSTKWSCMVLQEYKRPDNPYRYKNRIYSAKSLSFNLHVKGAGAVIITANSQSLTYVTTNLSVNYDGEANYTYEDGKDLSMDFSYIKAKNKKDTLRLEYYNAEGILLFQTKPRVTPHMFRSVMKSNNDKYYLDCIRTASSPEREYRYRTTFLKKRDLHAGAMILSVNGQRLSTLINNDKSYDVYIFRYIDGEVLNITCRKMDVNMRGTLTFCSKPDVNWLSQILTSPPGAVISLNISTSGIQNQSVICSINNTDVEKPNAQLFFLSDVPDYDVRIRGLPRNNILYQYTNDENQWTTEYQYSVNDILDLTCVSNGGFHHSGQQYLSPYPNRFQWKFEDKPFDSPAIGTLSSQIKYSKISFTQMLDATHNGTKIKCTYFQKGNSYPTKTVEIILRLKPELVSEAKRDEDTSGDKDQPGAGGGSEPNIVPFAVGVGVAIFIITMVCLVLWRKRTKRVNLIENAYDNLSNQNDSPIPTFPSQWEANYDDPNYAKIDDGVMQENYNYSTDNEKFYSMPFKRQSNTSENHYTEIDDYIQPKPDGLAVNGNTAQSSNYNKQTDILKVAASHSSNNASYNKFSDSKQGTYDKLRHNNLPVNNGYENYSKVQKPSKSKSVTFRQMSNDLRPERNYSEGNSRQDVRNNDRKFKLNNEGYYANTGQNIYMQPEVIMHKKPNYENNYIKNEKTDNPLDSDYAEPYDEVGISCKNDFYG